MSRLNESRALIYRLLATGFLYPTDLDWELFSNSFHALLEEAASDLALEVTGELDDLRACWVHKPDDALLHAYTELFVNSPRGILAPLNESVYIGEQQLVNTERTAQVARSYEAAGFTPTPQYQHLLSDHLSLELEFMALGLLQGWETRDFFLSHIYSWQPKAAERVLGAGISHFYSAMARLLIKFLDSENRLLMDEVVEHSP